MFSSVSTDPEVTDRAASAVEPPSKPRVRDDSRGQELVAILVMVLLADLTIYRGHGYAGLAAFLLLAPGLLLFGKPRRQIRASLWVVGGMLTLLAARLLWYGSPLQVILGFALVVAFATSLDGRKPFLLDVLATAAQAIVSGCRSLWEHLLTLRRVTPSLRRRGMLNIVLPAVAFLLFSTLFVLANPDAVTFVGREMERIFNAVSEWFVRTALRPTEFLFWIAVAWITAGLLRPMFRLLPTTSLAEREETETAKLPAEAPLFPAYRNTLVTVIGLFAVYLSYEFYTLWTREFPEGFYYAGYAHEGAAWLTVALALATLVLSLVFSGDVRHDPRLPKLRLLAWTWSLQNVLLSLAVYNRLFIYIDFNGMTRMRIVGLFGISVVVVGFLLVVWKIAHAKSFPWLIQRQLWALVVAVYLFALTPADGAAVSYNVHRVQRGDLSASMQIGVHELDLEGGMALTPLLDCSTPEIRQGASALVAERYLQLQGNQKRRRREGWTAYQLSERIALERFEAVRDRWKAYEDDKRREAAIGRFYEFAYQWY